MKAFRFRLQTVLEQTEKQEDQQKKTLASWDERLAAIQERIDAADRERDRQHRTFRNRMEKGADAHLMGHYTHHLSALREGRQVLAEQKIQLEEERDRCRQELVRIMRERKTLEKLRERQYEAYRSEQARAAEKEMDAFVSFRQAGLRSAGERT